MSLYPSSVFALAVIAPQLLRFHRLRPKRVFSDVFKNSPVNLTETTTLRTTVGFALTVGIFETLFWCSPSSYVTLRDPELLGSLAVVT